MSPLSPYLAFARRHRWTYGAALLAGLALAVVYLVVTPRSYRAVATTIVPYREAEADLRFGTGRTFPVQYAFVVNNHLEVMRSAAVHEELLRRLGQQHPDMLAELFPDKDEPQDQRSRIRALARRLRASSKDDTGILRLEAAAPSAECAADLANLAMAAYAEIQHGVNQRSLMEWLSYLQKEEERWLAELQERDDRLEQFRSEESLASLVDETRALMQERIRLEGEIASTRGHAAGWQAKRESRQRQLQELRDRIDQQLADTSAPLIRELRDQIAEDEAWYSFLQADGDTGSPELERLGNRIAEARSALARHSGALAQGAGESVDPLGLARSLLDQVRALDTEVEGGRARIDRLQVELDAFRTRLDAVPSLRRRDAQLERERELSAEIAKLVQHRHIEAEVESRRRETRLQAINDAAPPRSPSAPRPLLALVSSLLLAVLAGTAVGAVQEVLDPRLQDGDEAAELSGAPVLSRPRWDGGNLLAPEVAAALAIRSSAPAPRRVWLLDPDGRAGAHLAQVVARRLGDQGIEATATAASPNGAVQLKDVELGEFAGARDLGGAVVLVARARSTRRRALREAAEVLRRADVPCLGVVVL